jgi:hypothetical protein
MGRKLDPTEFAARLRGGYGDNQSTRFRESWIPSDPFWSPFAVRKNQRQLQAKNYLREENRALRDQLGDRLLLLIDD